jgi:hypothetical protein
MLHCVALIYAFNFLCVIYVATVFVRKFDPNFSDNPNTGQELSGCFLRRICGAGVYESPMYSFFVPLDNS